MPNLPQLRQKARLAICRGTLPSRRASSTRGGPGSGGVCNLCGFPVRASMTELEIEFLRDNEVGPPMIYRLHHRCFAAWQLERG
jgi:hypothetical protein